MKGWKEFDEQFLRPYKAEGTEAEQFWDKTIVFSEMQLRYVALLAFQAGQNSQKDK